MLTEIFLSEETNFGFSLHGYISETLYRNSHGGGIKVCYGNHIEVTRLNDLTFVRSETEIFELKFEEE